MTKRGVPVADVEKWQSIQYLLNAHRFQVVLQGEHSYRDWMRRELAKTEDT